MAGATSQQSDHNSPVIPEELSGRPGSKSRLPATNRLSPPDQRSARSPELARFSQQIEETLWNRLAWQSLPSENADVLTMVRAYNDSLNQIEDVLAGMQNLVRAICRANIEFRQESGTTNEAARDAALSATLNKMIETVAGHWRPLKNLINGRLTSQPADAIRPQLHDSLQISVHHLVEDFFSLFPKLTHQEIFGRVEWFPNGSCDYQFFKRVVIQSHLDSHQEVRREMFERPPEEEITFERREIGRERTIQHDSGTHTYRTARHFHSVIDAVRTSIGNSRVVIPLSVTEMIQEIPDWLYPCVEVIDGKIVREVVIERDTLVENWEQAITVQDVPIYGCEPAVLIGPYVLTGWGPREIDAELERRKTAQATAAETTPRNLTEACRAAWQALKRQL